MNWTLWMVVFVFAVAMFCTIAAALRAQRETWRKCARCCWFYDGKGNCALSLPPWAKLDPYSGLCPYCEGRRE